MHRKIAILSYVKTHKKYIFWAIAYVLLIALIYHQWFFNFGVRTHGDWGYHTKQALDTFRLNYFSAWLSDESFGRVVPDIGQAPTYALYGFFSSVFNLNFAISERLIHLWPAVLVAPIASYLLVKDVLKNNVAAVLGAIIYSSNTYFITLQTGHLTLAAAYAFAPLVIYSYMVSVRTRSVAALISCALLLTLTSAYEPRLAYILILILALYALIDFILYLKECVKINLDNIREVIIRFIFYVSPMVLFVFMNLFWILPIAKLGSSAGSAVIESSLFGNQYFNLLNSFTLIHPFWSGGEIKPFILQSIPIYFWLIPIMAIAGFVLFRKRAGILFFGILGLIGIFLTKQSSSPFEDVYFWLFQNIPGFNAFREASKFYLLTALSFSILIPAFYIYVSERYSNKNLNWIIGSVVGFLFVINIFPVASGKMNATFANRSMPVEYAELNKFLDQKDYFRVLWVPQKSRWGITSTQHPAVHASKVTNGPWRLLVDGDKNIVDNASTTDEIITLLKKEFMPSMLSSAGVKYVVVPIKDTKNNDNFFKNYGDDPLIFTSVLDNLPYLKRINTGIENLYVYETVKAPAQYISSSNNLVSFNDDIEIEDAYNLQQKLDPNVNFEFIINKKQTAYPFAAHIQDLHKNKLAVNSKKVSYYTDQSPAAISYDSNENQLNFTYEYNEDRVTLQQKRETRSVSIDPRLEYLYSYGGETGIVNRDSQKHYISPQQNNVDIYSITPKNALTDKINETFIKNGVIDCVNPQKNGSNKIRITQVQDNDLARSVLGVFTKEKAACTKPITFEAQGNHNFLIRLKYKPSKAQIISIRFDFANGPPVVRDIPINPNANWNLYESVIKFPESLGNPMISLIVRPSNQVSTEAGMYISSLQLFPIELVETLETSKLLEPAQQRPIITNEVQTKNLITNPSFEKGTWNSKVDDCNAYDDKPLIKMSLDTDSSDGSKSLRLSAARHIACTNQGKIALQGGKAYLLEFDHKSTTESDLGYALSFNDRKNTRVSSRLKVDDKDWHSIKKLVYVPPDATFANLSIFSYGDNDSDLYSVNNYDNFKLRASADLEDRYYSITDPSQNLAKPIEIKYSNTSNTSKHISVKTSANPFMLVMSEQFNSGWGLTVSHKTISQPIPERNHYEINGYSNGWLVDPVLLCKDKSNECTKDKEGNYSFSFVATFRPQSLVEKGKLISLLVITACLVVLTGMLLRSKKGGK